jgi:hypothetical protein
LKNPDPKVLAELVSETDHLFAAFPDAIDRVENAVELLRRLGSERYSPWLKRRLNPTFLRVKKSTGNPEGHA